MAQHNKPPVIYDLKAEADHAHFLRKVEEFMTRCIAAADPVQDRIDISEQHLIDAAGNVLWPIGRA